MRTLDVEGHVTEVLNDAVKKAKDTNTHPILLSFYCNRKESGQGCSGDRVKGKITCVM